MQTITQLAPFVPLAQTLLWVLLILFLVIWFRAHVRAVLDVVRKRIAEGSTVKAGPFELSELRPQSTAVQKERVEAEAAEVAQQEAPASAQLTPLREAKGSYLQSEDLALRAVQAEFGVPLSRQVSMADRAHFDAVFVRERLVYVVEVKLFLGYVTPSKLRGSVQRLSEVAWQLAGANARIVLALVYKNSEYIVSNAERVQEAITGTTVPVELRNYTLPDLQRQFGASSDA